MIDPMTPVGKTHMSEEGVLNILIGHTVSKRMRQIVVDLLRNFDPESYGHYKELKYGSGEATDETRRVAYAYALERFSAFVLKWYARYED